jgi:hypothetical protein
VALVSSRRESSLAPDYTFVSVKNTLGFMLGFHGFDDGLCGLVLGLHTHKDE